MDTPLLPSSDRAQQPLKRIIHVDMDAFFASVEMRDQPNLKGLPVIVGGTPEKRGVVAAASYEARSYGIRSAMACSKAQRLCPQAIFITPNLAKYREVSQQIKAIFLSYTPLVETISLDEAYLDVTDHLSEIPSATWIAEQIREKIKDITGLTASAGVSINKFLAKVASDQNKPDGICVLTPKHIPSFLKNLPLKKVPGIGPVTLKKFYAKGIETCGDLQACKQTNLQQWFGKKGQYFYELARGEDHRLVTPHRPTKSISVEETFAENQSDPLWVTETFRKMCVKLHSRLQIANLSGRCVTITVRLANFTIHTRSTTAATPFTSVSALAEQSCQLWQQSQLVGHSVRLLGVRVSRFDSVADRETASKSSHQHKKSTQAQQLLLLDFPPPQLRT